MGIGRAGNGPRLCRQWHARILLSWRGMTTQKHQRSDDFNPNLELGAVRTSGREYVNPVDYEHPYPSMARFAGLLALRYDANRTRHAYYRQVRLIHEHFACDPATLTEADLRDYFLHVKLKKHWLPKTIRQPHRDSATHPPHRACSTKRVVVGSAALRSNAPLYCSPLILSCPAF